MALAGVKKIQIQDCSCFVIVLENDFTARKHEDRLFLTHFILSKTSKSMFRAWSKINANSYYCIPEALLNYHKLTYI